MITKTIKVSGGDYDNLDTLRDDISTLLSDGFADDYRYIIQGGQAFTASAPWDFYQDNLLVNGHTITFESDPTDLAHPAIIDIGFLLFEYAGGARTAGTFIFKNLKIVGTPPSYVVFSISDSYSILKIINCLIYYQAAASVGSDIYLCDGAAGSFVRDTSIFLTIDSGSVTSIQVGGSVLLQNSIITSYNASNIPFTGQGSKNSTVYNYGGGGITVSGGVNSNILTTTPGLMQQVITTANDLPAVMAALNASLATGSSSIDSADPTTSESIDIIGTTRPQGAIADRGAYEFIPLAPITSVNKRRSVIKIAQVPGSGNSAEGRLHALKIYRIGSVVTGWAGKLIGLTSTGMAKVNGVAMGTIKKIMGV